MRKFILGLLVLAVIGTVAIVTIPAFRDEFDWRWASYRNQAVDYARYLRSWPAGLHCADAEKLYDDRTWEEAKATNTIKSFEDYLQNHPKGKYITLAQNSIEELRWEEANMAYTVNSFLHYIEMYSAGRHVTEARSNVTDLQSALSQNSRAIEGTIKAVDKSTRTITITTSMGEKEDLRFNNDTSYQKKGENRSVDDLISSDGVRIDYVNLPNGKLLVRRVSMEYSVSYCSCGSSCGCPLSRGCRAVRY